MCIVKAYFAILTISTGRVDISEVIRMNVAQRIQLIRIIEKIEKNPEFSNKLGVKNTSDFISDNNEKMNHSQLDEC